MLTNVYFGRPVSKLGFGAMRFPKKDGEIDQKTTNEMIRYALEHGVNYFDTAFSYENGENERNLATALKASGYPRESYTIADKMPFWKADSKEYLDKTFEESLRNLETDYIDFYLFHAQNEKLFEKALSFDAINWVNEKKRQGKIRYVGFSIHDSYDVLVRILDANQWDFVQIQYNYMDENDRPGKAGYDELVKRGIPIVIMEPLKGGMLSDLTDNIASPFRELGGSNASYSFRWLCDCPGIMTILSGMKAVEQVKENVEIFDSPKPLKTAEREAIAKVVQNVKEQNRIGCTGCGYCQPCPKGIVIPEIFHAWNSRPLYTGDNWVNGLDVNVKSASNCVKCGACVAKCPQKLAIPEKLAEIVESLKK